MNYQLVRTQQLFCDLDTAWHFFSSPFNLAHITPQSMKFTVLSDLTDQKIFEGMIINYTVSPLFGIPLSWQTKITQVNEGHSFTDTQQSGPFKRWNHIHEFIQKEDSVLMKDTVQYELPLGFLGTIAHSLMVRNKINSIFEHRYQVLEQLFNSKI